MDGHNPARVTSRNQLVVERQGVVLAMLPEMQSPAAIAPLAGHTVGQFGLQRPQGNLSPVGTDDRPRRHPLVGPIKLQRLAQLGRLTQGMGHRNPPFEQTDKIPLLAGPPPQVGAANADCHCPATHIDRALRLVLAENIGGQPEGALDDIERCSEYPVFGLFQRVDRDIGVLAQFDGTAVGQLNDGTRLLASQDAIPIFQHHPRRHGQPTPVALNPGWRLNDIDDGVRRGSCGQRRKQAKNRQRHTKLCSHRLSRLVQPV